MSDTINIRARVVGDETEVRVLIVHPMETGIRKDRSTGDMIPAHFIQKIIARHNGAQIFEAFCSTGVSRDPYLRFQIQGGKVGDSVDVSWVDNLGMTDSRIETII